MSWNIPLHAQGFPTAVQAVLPAYFPVDRLDLYWSALTVGRPNIATVLSHGPHSLAEIRWRLGTVDANVAVNPHVSGLYNSSAFQALDMTEKGWVNFSLGMLFTKLTAAKLLGMPWLFHFKWFQSQFPLSTAPGGSTPDFIGLNPATGVHHALEAKGRSAGFSTSVITAAKDQASQAIAVNGQPCGMHIGALLYRESGSRLAMAMLDPEGLPGPGWELQDDARTWAEYYGVAWGLAHLENGERDRLKSASGLTVDFAPEVYPLIKELIERGDRWKEARDSLQAWAARRMELDESDADAPAFQTKILADGIRISVSSPDTGSEDSERPIRLLG